MKDRRLERIEGKLDALAESVGLLREEVAAYRGAIRFVKWLVTLLPMAVGAVTWLVKRGG